MIEAANSALSNASLLRGSAEQLSSLRSVEVNAIDLSQSGSFQAPRAPYISPRVSIDSNFDQAVLQILDSETGDVLSQFPTERTLQSRQSEALRTERSVSTENSLDATFEALDSQRANVNTQTTNLPPVNNVSVQVQTSPSFSSQPVSTSSGAAQAQVAAAALANGAQASAPSTGSVSVTA